MPSQILSTKLYIPPPRTNLVSRPRLLDCLQRGLAGKLTLISAPAGYGKTTLLSEWISRNERPFGWLSLDDLDNDLQRFLTYLATSLESIPIAIDGGLAENLGASQANIYESFLIPLINQISAVQGHFALVLDDYHLIQNQEIIEAIDYLLENLPHQMHLVVATRTDPPLRLAQLRVRGELCEIRAEDLRFTDEEAFHFLNQSMGLGLESPDVTTLSKKTEGWIAGLQLAAISLQEQQDRHGFIRAFAGDNRYIADYLLDEALERQPVHIQSFLLETSILDLLCASLCNALTDRDDSQMILEELERANLFLVPLDSQRNWYRYHHLFASLLQHRLSAGIQLDVSLLHMKAAVWMIEHDSFNTALQHAIKADNIDQISSLFEKNFFSLTNNMEYNLLINWARKQPQTRLNEEPWVCLAVASALIEMSQLDDVECYLAWAEELVPTDPRLIAHIAVLRSRLADNQGDQDRMAKLARKALANIQPDDVQLHAVILGLLAKREFWKGNLAESQQIRHQAYEDNISSGDYEEAVHNLTEFGALQLVRGAISEGIETLNSAIRLSEITQQSTGHPLTWVGYTHMALADVLIDTGQIKDAQRHIQEGMRFSELVDQPKLSYIYYIILSKYQLTIGDHDQALRAVQEAQKMATTGGAEIRQEDYFNVLKVQIYLAKGDLLQATRLMDEVGLQTSDEFEFEKQLYYRIRAQLLIARGDYHNAVHLLSRLIEICLQAGATVHAMKAQIFHALAYYYLSDLDSALEALSPALSLGSSEGLLVQDFIDEGEPMAQLVYQASLRGIYPEFCIQLLNHFPTSPKPDVAPSDGLVEPLSEREIEVLVQIAEGHTNQEIAQELVLSLYTVKSHARNIYSKLGVKNRTEAAARGRLLGLVPQD